MAATPIVTPTVEARILLGWMERDPAVDLLTRECVFDVPLTPEAAEDIWRGYKERVNNLPARDAAAPQRLPLDDAERKAAAAFMQVHRGSTNIREVIKIDPSNLVTHQPVVVLDQTEKYIQDATSAANYAKHSLGVAMGVHNIQVQHQLNAMDIAVPHGEFAFVFNQQTHQFQVMELARHISVSSFGDRMLLWAGYHRSYARIANANPEGMDRSLLVALTTDADFLFSPESPNQGLRQIATGLRPTLFRDFFDPDFFMAVPLKRKRFVLQVRANCVPTDV